MFHRRFLLGLTAFASITAASALGCSTAAEEEPVDALDSALSQQDFDATVKHLGALPWLPWTYLTDGCYARALYYSMLLATKNVPTNHLYVVRKQGAPPLFGIWGWHVAPVVTKDGDPNHLYVLDPAYDQTKALTNVEWVAKQHYPDPAAPNYPSLHVHDGNSYLDQFSVVQTLDNPGSPDAATYKEPAYSEMPAFAMSDVSAACLRMHMYIDREPNSTPEIKAQKHKGLGRETQRLVQLLAPKGKISGTPTLPAQCTRGEVLEPEPGTGTSGGTAPGTGTSGGTTVPGTGTSGGAEPTEPTEPFVEPTRAEP